MVGVFYFCCLVPAVRRCLSSRMPVSYNEFYWEIVIVDRESSWKFIL